jgi:hypothetical protein
MKKCSFISHFFPNKKQHKKWFPLVLIDNEPKKAPLWNPKHNSLFLNPLEEVGKVWYSNYGILYSFVTIVKASTYQRPLFNNFKIFLFTITLLRLKLFLVRVIYRELDNGDWTNICTFLDYFLHFHPIVFPFPKIFNVLCLHTKSLFNLKVFSFLFWWDAFRDYGGLDGRILGKKT